MKLKMMMLATAFLVAVQGYAVPAPTAADAAGANNAFGFQLLKNVTKRTEKGNKFISPVSLYMALSMLLNGAQGATADEIKQVLALANFGRTEANAANLALLNSLNGNRDLVLKIANSLWSRQGFRMRPEFLNQVQSSYRASAAELDFNLPIAPATINRWVSEATAGKIDKIVPDVLPAEAVLYLINAANFEADWADKFKSGNTSLWGFRVTEQHSVRVPMMNKDRARVKVYRQRGSTTVEIPYKGNSASMVIMLPEGGQTLNNLVASMSGEAWSRITANLTDDKMTMVQLRMPKMKFSYDTDNTLNDTLKTMGMPLAFSQRNADLKGIANENRNLYVSNVKQKTFLQVDEEGTKAAAVSSVEVGLESAIVGGQISIDRPFLFAIRDRTTNAVLFVGTINEPEGGVMTPR